MKKLGTVLAVVLALGASAPAGANAPINAAVFAADCADGTVVVDGTMNVFGGVGVIRDGICAVQMTPHSRLFFRDARLLGADVFLVIADAQQHTRVEALRTSIEFTGAESAIQLSPGCCAGDPEEGRDERYGWVEIIDSSLHAATVEVSASYASSHGQTFVKRSRIVATHTDGLASLRITASNTGSHGHVLVEDSDLRSGDAIRIDTFERGRTLALRNRFLSEPALIYTGPRGTCISRHNVPETPCVAHPGD
ncbi:MAG TPA: hypothetical protein VM638_04730 [Actinomycetota bacterium]|nr:hypothetical protein [Actinomycetota bacterium]